VGNLEGLSTDSLGACAVTVEPPSGGCPSGRKACGQHGYPQG